MSPIPPCRDRKLKTQKLKQSYLENYSTLLYKTHRNLYFYTLTIKDQNNKLKKQKIKFLGIKLPQEAKDLYSENRKMLIKGMR